LPLLIFNMRKLTFVKTVVFLFFLLCYTFNSYAQSEGTIKVQSNESIKQLVAKKRAYNKNRNEIKVREQFNSVFPDIRSELKFNSPDWKVWAGSYKTKLEADKALADIKEGFPSAIRITTKIKL